MLLGLLALLGLLPAGAVAGCREAHLPRDCQALCSISPRGEVTACELRAAVLLPNDSSYEISMPKVLPVLDLAVMKVRQRRLLPSWLKLRFLAKDDGCDATYAQIGAIDSYTSCVHVFFGPSCDYCVASVGRMTKFLDAPLITTGAFTFDFTQRKRDCRDEYFMTVRMGALAFRDIAFVFINLMDRYQWKKIHLLYDPKGQAHVTGRHTCQLMMKSMVEYVKKRQDLDFGTSDIDASSVEDYPDVLRDHVGVSYGETEVKTETENSRGSGWDGLVD